jgi:hypothetical protein
LSKLLKYPILIASQILAVGMACPAFIVVPFVLGSKRSVNLLARGIQENNVGLLGVDQRTIGSC